MLKQTENEETRLFVEFFVIGAISIEAVRAPWATPLATPILLRQDRALSPFIKKQTFKAKIKITFFSKPRRTRVKSLDSFLKPPRIV